MELKKEILVHGKMHYRCEQCGEIFTMYLEKGVEGPEKIQPCPFTIGHTCGGLANHVMWGLDEFFIPRPLKVDENYFALDLEYGCGKSIFRGGE